METLEETGAGLGAILGGVVRGVIEAQELMDDHARRSRERALVTPAGAVVVPPLWFTFSAVAVEVELSATLVSQGAAARLHCRTLSPAHLGLYGREAAANVRVRCQIEPVGVLPVRRVDDPSPSR